MATIQGIYIALFGRPADPLGLEFFNEATQNGADLTAIGDLAATAEYQDRFEGMNNAQIVTEIYLSLFGRPPELAGLTFFVTALNNGDLNINNVAIAILDGAQGTDADIIANKLVAADAWTTAIAADPAAMAAYNGAHGIAAGQAYLSGITADASTIPGEAALADAIVNLIGGSNPGETFALTTEIDTLVGGDGDDTFIAGVTAKGDPTLNPGDSIDGGGGIDRIDLYSTGNITAFAGAAVKNVEKVYAQFNASGTTLDVSGNGDVTEAWFSKGNLANANGNATISLTKGQAGGITGAVVGQSGADHSTSLTFDFQGVAGATDAATLKLDGASISSRGVGKEATVSTSGIENLTIEATGSNSIGRLADGNLESLTIKGDGSVSLSHSGANLESIDGSANTGGFTVDISAAGPNDITVKGGSGNDELVVDYGDLTKKDSIDLGEGSNTLAFRSNAWFDNEVNAGKLAGVSNVQVLKSIGAHLSIDGNFVDQNSFVLKGTGSNINAVNLDNDASITYQEGDHGWSFTGLKLGASTLNLNLQGSKAAASQVGLDANGTKIINISSSNPADNGDWNSIFVQGDANQDVNITGSGKLDAGFFAFGAAGYDIDGSAFTGSLRILGTQNADVIKGGSGDDVLRGEEHADIPGRGQASTITFAAEYDDGDVITIKYNGKDYTYTVDSGGAQGGTETIAAILAGNLANFEDVGANKLSTVLAGNNVDVLLGGTVLTLEDLDTGDTFTLEASVDNAEDEYATSATQTLKKGGAYANGDKVLVVVNGSSYSVTLVNTAAPADWTYTGPTGNINVTQFLEAVAGGSDGDASITLSAADTLTITAPNYVANTGSFASATIDPAGTVSLHNTAATGAPTDQAQPVVELVQPAAADGDLVNVIVAAADVYTGGAGEDVFIVATATGNIASDADVITDFVSGEDSIVFNFNGFSDARGDAGTVLNYAEGTSAVANFTAALAAANAQVDGTVIYSAQQVGADTYVFYDGNRDGVIDGNDYLVKLTGVGLDGIAHTDIG